MLGPIGAQGGFELSLITFDADATDPDVPAQTLEFSESGLMTKIKASCVWMAFVILCIQSDASSIPSQSTHAWIPALSNASFSLWTNALSLRE